MDLCGQYSTIYGSMNWKKQFNKGKIQQDCGSTQIRENAPNKMMEEKEIL